MLGKSKVELELSGGEIYLIIFSAIYKIINVIN